MGSVATTTLVLAGFLVLISLVQPIAERLRLPYAVLLAIVGVAVGGLSTFLFYSPSSAAFCANTPRPKLRSITSLRPGPARMRSAPRSRAGHRSVYPSANPLRDAARTSEALARLGGSPPKRDIQTPARPTKDAQNNAARGLSAPARSLQ